MMKASYLQWSPFSVVAGTKGDAGLPSSDHSVFSLSYGTEGLIIGKQQ